MTRFWVGGYGSDMGGAAEGIGVVAGDEGRPQTTLAYRGLAAAAASPSWLASHPWLDVVYAALEGDGTVAAFARDGDTTLTPSGEPIPVGEAVCHLAVAPSGAFLIASCYGDGRVVRLGIAADGSLVRAASGRDGWREESRMAGGAPASGPPSGSAPAIRLADTADTADTAVDAAAPAVAATDPYPTPAGEQPRVSRAHAGAFLPDGRIATTDLGFDLVRIWRPSDARLALDHEIALPRGTGPRHLVAHPSGHLHVITEYSCEVFTLASGPDGRWTLVGGTIATPTAQVGADFPAELARSRDGETLYTALRGSNTIAALRVRGAGEIVEPFAVADSGVDWPRHHLVHEGALLVAGQRSDTISVLELDERTGVPRGVRHTAPAPTPSHLLPMR